MPTKSAHSPVASEETSEETGPSRASPQTRASRARGARPSVGARLAGFAYAGLAYLTFFAAFAALAFRAMGLLDGTIFDRGPRFASTAVTVAFDRALVLVFGVQHSVMARRPFKRWLGRFLAAPFERATYVWASNLAILAVVLFWAGGPGGEPWWHVTARPLARGLLALGVIGWVAAAASSFLIDHFELFGLRQVSDWARGVDAPMPKFRAPGAYRWVRHPMMASLLVGFWSAPVMNLSRAVLACGMTVYVLVGIFFEERELIARFGRTYRDYQKRVWMLLPLPPRPFRIRAPQ